jgi:peptidoglycan/xylan/chitin deacetylase (PgdA/CDA1 family)
MIGSSKSRELKRPLLPGHYQWKGAFMLFENAFSASSVPSFPNRTVCLTFDDGPAESNNAHTEPGPHSLELAQYLQSVDVQATFFMVGRQMQEFPGIAEQISALGHQVGVHTYDHVGLDDCLTKNRGDVVRQVSLTTTLLPGGTGQPFYLRAPYGQWSPAVAQAINADLLTCVSCFGPIHWDNTASDWDKWLDDVSPADVSRQYLDDINQMGKGIILMHDNMANVRRYARKNQGLALARNLVPALLDAGYRLCRVDAIPGIASRAAATPPVALRGANQAYVSCRDGGGGEIMVSGAAPSWWEELTVVPLGSNCLALRAQAGQYLSLQDADGSPVTATATEIGDWETFEGISCSGGSIIFRTFTGDFLTISDRTMLVGNGAQTDPNNRFSFSLYANRT